jgi:hypothetical protein
MDRRYKLIHHRDRPENSELYDLESDPAELRNVAHERPDELRRLLATLEPSGAMDLVPQMPAEPLDEEALEKLRSLGYAR